MKKPPLPASTILRLKIPQREMLIAHIDGEVPVVRSAEGRSQVRDSLILHGLLRGSTNTPRPRATVLTEDGRRALGIILGDYADALSRAGLFEQADPVRVLKELKALRVGAFAADPILPEPGAGDAEEPVEA